MRHERRSVVTVVGGGRRLAAGGWHSRARVSVFSGDPAVLWHLIQVRSLLVSAISTNGCAGRGGDRGAGRGLAPLSSPNLHYKFKF